MSKITLTWHTVMDDRTCPTCKKLNGYQWTFITGKNTFPNILLFNGQDVWDVHQGSRAHGHEQFNCRCHITAEIDISDLKPRIEKMKEQLTEAVNAEGTNIMSQRGNYI